MITILRKNQKALWIVIALLCIPFVFYFNKSDTARIAHDDLGQFHGRSVSKVEFQRNARLLNLARDLGMFTFLQDMVAGARSENEVYVDFTWNHLILHHEAERLGIVATGTEIGAVVKGMMAFRGATGFELEKYNKFTQTVLPPMGFGEAQIEELAADQLILVKLKTLIGAGASIPESEIKENYEKTHGQLSVGVVRVKTEDLAKTVQISDEDVAKYFEAHKAELKSEEKRRVSFVSFGLDEAQSKLTGKERVEVLQKLADRANDFNQALLEKDAQFDQVAAKFTVPVVASEFFVKSKPDAILSANPQLAESAFQLKAEEPNTDAIQVKDGFYVLHLLGIQEAKPLTLEEAKPRILEAMKKQRVAEMLAAKGAEAVRKIREALKSGTALEAALQQTGLPMEKIPPFALADRPVAKAEPDKPPQPEAPDLPAIKSAIAELNPGEVTEFVPIATGGVVAVLEKRDPPDPAGYAAAKAVSLSSGLQNKRAIAFYEWLRERRREAGVQPPVDIPGEPDAG